MITNVMERLIDFTRTSGGGYFGPDGLFRFTPASRNLLTYTQEFENAAWTKLNMNAFPFDPALATFGPELVTNGTFDGGTTGWSENANATLSVVSGALRVTAIANGTAYAAQAITTVPGRTYRITVTYVTDAITGNAFLYAGTAAGSGNIGNLTIGSTLGAHTLSFVATGTTTYISVSNSTLGLSGEYMDFDNISVREVTSLGLLAPDGTLTADAVLPTASTASHSISQSGGSAGTPSTFSVYAKAASSAFVQLWNGAAASIYANFNLLTGAVGTVGAGATAAITPVGDGWYRCSITYTPATLSQCRIAMITSTTAVYAESWAATGTESIYLWGAQLELAAAATEYTRNFGGLFPPRFDYDPVTLAPRGLLIEEQRTNLLLRSEEFDNAAWTKSNTTVTANAGLSPDGTADADFLVENTATAAHDIYAGSTLTAASHTFSVYVKPNGRSWVNLFVFQSGGATNTVWFDISSGTIGTVAAGTTASITHSGNGWYRCSITFTALAAGSSAYVRLSTGNNVATYTGDGTSGVFLWGAQVEVGSFATSYIPTAASQVTRAADNATITGANFSRWYNQSEGTLVVEAESVVPTSTSVFRSVGVTDGSTGNTIAMFVYNSRWGGSLAVGGVNQADLQVSASYAQNVPAKSAFAYKVNDVAFSANGSAALTDAAASIPAVDRLAVGVLAPAWGGFMNGRIRRIRYYPTRLSNTQLQALTA